MDRFHAPTKSSTSGPGQRPGTGTALAASRRVKISPFWQHFLEMFAAMWIGMVAGTALFLAITGQPSPRQAALLYPVQALVGMALSMTVPMVAWMLYRGHGWRNSAEMAAAMLVPAIPFAILAGMHVIKGTTCCAYMALSTLAMLGLMFYRRDVYSAPMRAPRRGHPRQEHRRVPLA